MLSYLLLAVSGLCLVASLLPLVPMSHGLIRIFDFGRLQVIAVALPAALIAGLTGMTSHVDYLSVAMAGCAVILQVCFVLRFTPLWWKQTKSARTAAKADATISVLTCNVKQGNRDYARVADLVRERQPDIAMFMETDDAWAKALRPCLADFTETIEHPLDNSYGMILASRLPLADASVRFLLNEEVPSITGIVSLANGAAVRIVALHPEPPVPTRDTMGRDAEILVVAEEARDESLPMLVTGDLNDVAWSRTTRRFLRISRLLDPRQGRGLFNSFHAQHWFLRWPLDHIFHSDDFMLVSIERLPDVGSDHFPMYYCFELAPSSSGNTPPPASSDDLAAAEETIDTEKNRNRAPVGTDWE